MIDDKLLVVLVLPLLLLLLVLPVLLLTPVLSLSSVDVIAVVVLLLPSPLLPLLKEQPFGVLGELAPPLRATVLTSTLARLPSVVSDALRGGDVDPVATAHPSSSSICITDDDEEFVAPARVATDGRVSQLSSTTTGDTTGPAGPSSSLTLTADDVTNRSLPFSGSSADCDDKLSTEPQLIGRVQSSSPKPASVSG
uniref:Putative secreted protein n=1 Tax=Anopheles darlingi TaxID=43151 RepID=A0A2M4DFL2_ANODA